MSNRKAIFIVCSAALSVAGLVQRAGAARIWSGAAADSFINTAENWVANAPPLFSTTNSANNDAVFLGTTNTTIVVPINAIFRNTTFDTNAGSFTFVDDGTATSKVTLNGSTAGSFTINTSPNTQTFSTANVSLRKGKLNASAGDFVFNAPLNMGDGVVVGSLSETVGLNFDTTHNIYLNQGMVGATGSRVDKYGGGTLFVAESPVSAANTGATASGRWAGQLSIAMGNVEISNDFSLGDTDPANWTEIRSAFQGFRGDDTAAVVLTNNITSGEYIYMAGRPNDNAHIVNKSGANTLSGTLVAENALGNNINTLRSDGVGVNDKFIVSGEIQQISDLSSTLALAGAGNGLISGTITQPAGFGANTWDVVKQGTGTWTLTGNNTYTGTTTIEQGALVLSGAGSISTSSVVHVKSGATFDVSALSGGYTLPATQTLKGAGTVIGSIASSSGSKIAPGDSAGVLSISSGDLTLVDSTTLQYELSTNPAGVNDKIAVAGNLSLSGTSSIEVTKTGGFLTSGSYRLIDYTGVLTGNASNFTLSGLTGGGSTRPQSYAVDTSTLHQVNLIVTGSPGNLTWVGGLNSNSWDVIGTVNWTGATDGDNRFYNGDLVTFGDAGSTSPNVNIQGSVGAAQLTFTNGAGHDYTISGGDLVVAGDTNFSNAGSVTLANSGISISGSLTTSGAGNIAITNSSAMAVAGNFTKGGSGNLTVNNSGGLLVGGTFSTSGSGNVSVQSGFSAGGMVLNGTGTVTLSGNSQLTLPGSIALNSGVLEINRNSDYEISSAISGAGSLRVGVTNVATLSGNNSSFTGPITVTAGTLRLKNAGALGTADGVTTVNDGATLDLYGVSTAESVVISGFGAGGTSGALADTIGAGSLARGHVVGITLAGDSSFRIEQNSLPFTDGPFQGNGHDFTVFGGLGELTLVNVGDMNVKNLSISNLPVYFFGSSSFNSNPEGVVNVSDNGRVAMFGATPPTKPMVMNNGAIESYASNNTVASPVTLQGAMECEVWALSNATFQLNLDGKLTGPGDFSVHTFINSTNAAAPRFGIVALTSDDNDFSGQITIGGGGGYSDIFQPRDHITLSVGNGGATGKLGTGNVNVGPGATLAFNRTGLLTVPNQISGDGTVLFVSNGGTITLSGNNSYGGPTVVRAGAARFTTNAQQPILNNNGADIQGGRIILDYTTTPKSDIRSKLTTSFQNAGFANTTEKLRSSTATAELGLGMLDDPTAQTITVAYAYYGDANLDGNVNALDFNLLASNFSASDAYWQQGDFNYSGTVDSADFSSLAQNFNKTLIVPAGALGSLVPEPGTLGALACLALALPRRRRR